VAAELRVEGSSSFRGNRIIEGEALGRRTTRIRPAATESLPGLWFHLFIEKGHRLDARDLKALAAANVLAGDKVVAPDHVGTGFGKFRAVTLVSPRRQLALLGSNEPTQFVFGGLMAMRAV
jgi:hypothetical protein